MGDDNSFGKWCLALFLGIYCWPLLIPVLLGAYILAGVTLTFFIGSIAVAIGGVALEALIATAAIAGGLFTSFFRLILFVVTAGRVRPAPLGQTVGSIFLMGALFALLFFYMPVHPIQTKAEDVSRITVTDRSGEHIIDYPEYVEQYINELKGLGMHRSFKTVTEEDSEDHSATLVLYGADGEELETFQMLDDKWFTIKRAKKWESFKAYTFLGQIHNYKDFIKIYKNNETDHDIERIREVKEQYSKEFEEFESSLSVEGTQLHFRIPDIEETDNVFVSVKVNYYKEPEPGKLQNRAVEYLLQDVGSDYWEEGKDYYVDLAGRQYYEVTVSFYVDNAGKSFNCYRYMPQELLREKKRPASE